MKHPRGRWIAWRKIDDGSGACAESREARLDALLRAGAARELSRGEGRLRWRVLGAITSKRQESTDAPGRIIGALGRRGGALAACAILVAGIGLTWLTASRPRPSAPVGTGLQPRITLDDGAGPAVTATDRGGIGAFARRALTIGPTAAIAVSIESSYQREKERVLSDARVLASSFARRVTAPIAALNRGVQQRQDESVIKPSRSGGDGGA